MSTVRFRTACEQLFTSITIEDGKAFITNTRTRKAAFNRFCLKTRTDWEHLARSILRKYKVGPDTEVDDVVQELYTAAYRYMTDFDVTRGTDFDKFLIFQAIVRAKRWVHRARGANMHDPDKKQSRLPVYLEDVCKRGGDGNFNDLDHSLPELLQLAASQDRDLMERRAYKDALKTLRTVQSLCAFHAIWETGRIEDAVTILVDDEDMRRRAGIRGRGHARKTVVNTIKEISANLQQVDL